MSAIQSHQALAASMAPPSTTATLSDRRFVTINELETLRPFSRASARDLKFKAHDRKNSRGDIIKGNGTGPAGVWVQIGTKVLVDLDAFDRWIESHKAKGG